MIKAMIGAQRDPRVLAGLARGRMKAKHDALVEALTGMFDDHHGELAQMLLDQIAFCDTRIAALATRIEQHLAQVRAAWGVDADGSTGPSAGTGPDAAVLPAAQRLAEIPGASAELARSIIAGTGLDMSRFLTAAHLVLGRALPLRPPVRPPHLHQQKGQGDGYLRGYLGERHRRIARRRGRAKAQVAVGRSILVIIWHLLASPKSATPTSAPPTTPAAPTRTRRSATTSASSRRSA